MSTPSEKPESPIAPIAESSGDRLELTVYQLAADELFRKNRNDGTGWEWSWADWRRAWMTNTQAQFAYRCLPLTIANQTGWWVYNPVSFSVFWTGDPSPNGIRILFDKGAEVWSPWINGQFGHGIITWNTPFLFVTRPEQSRLLVSGPVNYFKHGAQPLTAIIESDWMKMSFTMNWKLTAPNAVVRFEVGEPLFQIIPFVRNVGADLEVADIIYKRLGDDPAVETQYRNWDVARRQFHQKKAEGAVSPNAWQKEYFKGVEPVQENTIPGHRVRLQPPKVRYHRPGS